MPGKAAPPLPYWPSRGMMEPVTIGAPPRPFKVTIRAMGVERTFTYGCTHGGGDCAVCYGDKVGAW